MLDRAAFDLDRILSLEPGFLERHDGGADDDHGDEDEHHGYEHDHVHHRHDKAVGSVSLRAGELDPQRFFPWINQVTQEFGPDILRLKGILAFRDDGERYVVQGIHMIIEGDHQRAWRDGETRESRLVFIGRNLDESGLKAGFEACLA